MEDTEIISYARELGRVVKEHEDWRTKTTLNLIASENFASPKARSYLSSDLSNRYSARDHFYRGTKYTDEVEALATKLAKKLYRAKFADVRPLSGHTCYFIACMSLLKPGNRILTCPPKYGYPGISELGLGPLLSLKNLYFPYDPAKMNIIQEEARKMISAENPEMTVFGSSFIPFPYEIGASLPQGYNGFKIYDGSHVMGLIAGRQFQDPLREGCSILMGSTHKSLFGPQGGLILSNDEEVFSKMDAMVAPGIVDNIHWNRVAMLAYAMVELLKFGESYAKQVISNSKTLAKALDDLGIPVRCREYGYTKSHQILLDFDEAKSIEVADLLQDLDIITDTAIRIGTAEVTRRGMKQKDMETIASILSDAINRKASKDSIRRRVHKLVREFDGIEYTLSKE